MNKKDDFMKLTDEMISRAKVLAEEFFLEYEVFGIRVQDLPFEVGRLDHNSHVWEDGEDTGVELDGVCAVKIDEAGVNPRSHYYFGEHAAVIAGNRYTYGEDPGEIIIKDAVVVEVLI